MWSTNTSAELQYDEFSDWFMPFWLNNWSLHWKCTATSTAQFQFQFQFHIRKLPDRRHTFSTSENCRKSIFFPNIIRYFHIMINSILLTIRKYLPFGCAHITGTFGKFFYFAGSKIIEKSFTMFCSCQNFLLHI